MTALRLLACCISILSVPVGVTSDVRAGLVPEQWASRRVEIRGVWMDKGSIPKTESEIRDLVRRYAKAGLNLLHPEAIFNGYSMYPSSYLTQSDRWDGLDVLGIIIDEAHKHGMEVHPWVWVFRVGHSEDKGPILEAHPEWVAVNKKGEAVSAYNGYWLCPSLPAARRLMLRALTELVQKYPVDGVQLDYIRFENQEPAPYCYNDSCRSKFKAEYEIDPLDIQPFTKLVVDWHLWRENLVSTFVAEASREMKKVRPEVKVSAAVGSLPEGARMNLLQNWRHWVANNWVDFLAPMDYTADSLSFLSMVCDAYDVVGRRTLIAPGIGLYTQDGSGAMLEQVHVARTVPVSGVTLFATAYLDAERLRALAAGPFKKRARLPFRLPIEAADQLITSARDRLRSSRSLATISEASLELTAARDILEYVSWQSEDVGYLAPMRPPIFVPEVLQPLPSVSIPMTDVAPRVDGKLNDPAWEKAAKVGIELTDLGYEVTQRAEVLMTYDSNALYIAFRCVEPRLEALQSTVVQRDGPVFQDDSVEMFLTVAGDNKDYVHLVVNSVGTRYDSKRYDASWNPEWQAATGREPNAWTVETAIPFASLETPPPQKGTSWRSNFCRNRVLGRKKPENMCWSATYGSFHTTTRFGKITFAGEREQT